MGRKGVLIMSDFKFIALWLILAIAVGVYASKKGRSAGGFILLSLILSPLIGFIFALAADDHKNVVVQPNEETHKKCPYCAELILKDAKKCKHCGSEILENLAQ